MENIKRQKEAISSGRENVLALLLKPASPTPLITGSARSFHSDTERGIKVMRYCKNDLIDSLTLVHICELGRLGVRQLLHKPLHCGHM